MNPQQPTSALEVALLALVAAVQLLSLLVSQVLARKRQRATVQEIKAEQTALVRSLRPAAPPCGVHAVDQSQGFPDLPCELPRGHAGDHRDASGLWWRNDDDEPTDPSAGKAG